MDMDKNTLQMVGEWAHEKVASGEEPPWTQPKLKLLARLMDEIVESMNATVGIDTGAPVPEPSFDADDTQTDSGNIISLERFRAPKSDPDFPLPA